MLFIYFFCTRLVCKPFFFFCILIWISCYFFFSFSTNIFIGPLLIDGDKYQIPMATTEGCLVASTSRGCKAITSAGGVTTVLVSDGMTRGPALRFPNIMTAHHCKAWLDDEGFSLIEEAFNSTSRFARLRSVSSNSFISRTAFFHLFFSLSIFFSIDLL